MWTMGERWHDFGFVNRTKTINFSEKERDRLRAVMGNVLRRHKRDNVDPSRLIKDLMGLTNHFDITDDERAIISGALRIPNSGASSPEEAKVGSENAKGGREK